MLDIAPPVEGAAENDAEPAESSDEDNSDMPDINERGKQVKEMMSQLRKMGQRALKDAMMAAYEEEGGGALIKICKGCFPAYCLRDVYWYI